MTPSVSYHGNAISRCSKTTVKRPLSIRHKIDFQDQLSLNAGQKYCRIQYFRPSFSYHLSLRSLFCLFSSGCIVHIYIKEGLPFGILMQDNRLLIEFFKNLLQEVAYFLFVLAMVRNSCTFSFIHVMFRPT